MSGSEHNKVNTKGNFAAGLEQYVGVALIIMVIAATLIALAAFKDSQVTDTAGCNADTTTSCNTAYQTIEDTETFFTNFTAQFGTIGTIAGIILLIGVVVGGLAFGYTRMRR